MISKKIQYISQVREKELKNMSLNEFKDTLAKEAFGMTKAQATEQGLCISCKEIPKFYSAMGRREYSISGLCEYCFDQTTAEEECKTCGRVESFHTYKPNKGECNEYIPKARY